MRTRRQTPRQNEVLYTSVCRLCAYYLRVTQQFTALVRLFSLPAALQYVHSSASHSPCCVGCSPQSEGASTQKSHAVLCVVITTASRLLRVRLALLAVSRALPSAALPSLLQQTGVQRWTKLLRGRRIGQVSPVVHRKKSVGVRITCSMPDIVSGKKAVTPRQAFLCRCAPRRGCAAQEVLHRRILYASTPQRD